MSMRKIFAVLVMACILIGGCGETATTQATVETATTQATVETATTQATAETATTQATAETSTEQEHVEPYGIYTVYYEDKEVQVEWEKDAITFIIGTAKYTEEEEDWMEKTYEILSNPQKKVEFEDEYAYEEDDKFIQLETPSGTVFKFDELPKSTSEWFMVNIEAYWTITSLEESF